MEGATYKPPTNVWFIFKKTKAKQWNVLSLEVCWLPLPLGHLEFLALGYNFLKAISQVQLPQKCKRHSCRISNLKHPTRQWTLAPGEVFEEESTETCAAGGSCWSSDLGELMVLTKLHSTTIECGIVKMMILIYYLFWYFMQLILHQSWCGPTLPGEYYHHSWHGNLCWSSDMRELRKDF